jgi:hypothetical protein
VEHNQDKVTKGEGVIAPSPGLHNNTSREGNDARRCRRCWPSRKTGITPEDLGTRWSRRGGPALAASGDAPPPGPTVDSAGEAPEPVSGSHE